MDNISLKGNVCVILSHPSFIEGYFRSNKQRYHFFDNRGAETENLFGNLFKSFKVKT